MISNHVIISKSSFFFNIYFNIWSILCKCTFNKIKSQGYAELVSISWNKFSGLHLCCRKINTTPLTLSMFSPLTTLRYLAALNKSSHIYHFQQKVTSLLFALESVHTCELDCVMDRNYQGLRSRFWINFYVSKIL